MYPVLHSIYPIYSAHGRVAWLLSNIYTNYDDAFTPPDLWLSVKSLPDYQSCSSLALLADTAYLYTANDVRFTLFKGGTAHRPLSYLLWAQYTLSGGRL